MTKKQFAVKTNYGETIKTFSTKHAAMVHLVKLQEILKANIWRIEQL